MAKRKSKLTPYIEALIFATDQPISRKEIRDCLNAAFEQKFAGKEIDRVLVEITTKYEDEAYPFQVIEINDSFQFLTKGAYHDIVGAYLKMTTKKRLSSAALETLAIIAYKQPLTKTEMEEVRGVSCDYAVQKLLEKELVAIIGRSEGPGRPLLYGTSDKFMDYFGLKNLSDLPKPKDFRLPESEVGERAPIEESVAAKKTKAEAKKVLDDSKNEEEE